MAESGRKSSGRFWLYLLAVSRFAFRIKTKKSKARNSSKARQTLAKRIRELAETNSNAALGLAAIGAELTEIQETLRRYYVSKHECELVESGQRGQISKSMEQSSGNVWDQETIDFANRMIQKIEFDEFEKIARIFQEAVKAGDSKKVIEIGESIEVLQSLAGKVGDKFRREILFWGFRLRQRGEKWKIRRLAKEIGWPDLKSQDGFSRLRKLCNELKFPLEASRQIRDE